MTISLENQLPDLPAHPPFHKESTTAILPQTGMVQELLDPVSRSWRPAEIIQSLMNCLLR